MGKIRQKELWWCQKCAKLRYFQFTSELINHLKKRHGITANKKMIEESRTPKTVKER